MPKIIKQFTLFDFSNEGLLNVKPISSIEIPLGAEILCIQNVDGLIILWAIIDNQEELIKRVFEYYTTKRHLPEGIELKYIGTFQLWNGGSGHVFEHVFN